MIPDSIAYILPFICGVFLTLQGGSSGQLAKFGRGFAGSVTLIVSCVMGIVLYLVLSEGGKLTDFEKARSAGMNSTMGRTSYGPWFTTMYSLLTAAIPMFILFAYEYYQQPINFKEAFQTIPWWAYLAGPFGFVYVLVVTLLAPQLGAANLLGIVICAQVLGAVALDHFGGMRMPVRKITVARFVGAVLMIGGVVMVTLFR
ncbi:hypothetical protein HDU76_002772 [Blyttiomyces sp. JEL0837]|nr:hypothetical protein HDU76_002772 [Blyttiomyces sp. JEL0837]